MAFRVASVLALAPGAAVASYANIYGVCNYYGSWVHFTNTECGGNNCDAAPNGGKCDAHRAFIPKCESAGDYGDHHMNVRSDDGKVNWSIWKSDDAGKIRGGGDYGIGVDMTDEVSKGEWNVVINPDGAVSLYATADPNNCPPPPAPGCQATRVQGSWQYQFSVVAPTTISWTHGTSKTHEESKTDTWSTSVTTTVAAGFELDGESSSVSVATTISNEVAKSYSNEWTMNTEETFQVAFGDNDVGKAVWQFVFEETDSCGHSEKSLLKQLALTPNAASMPCCLPGYFADPTTYTTCLSRDTMVPGVAGCIAGDEGAGLLV